MVRHSMGDIDAAAAGRSARRLCQLLALSAWLLVHGDTALAGALDNTRFAACMKGWDIQWRLPYFPQFNTGHCAATESKPAAESALFSGLPSRRVKVGLNFDNRWFPWAPGDTQNDKRHAVIRREQARLAYDHFDRLLTTQEFRRVEGPRESGDSPDARIPTFAAYEKPVPGGSWRVELAVAHDNLTITLEQRGALRPDARLPAPAGALDITEPGANAKWFAASGSRLESEVVRYAQTEVAWPAELATGRAAKTALVYAPLREFRFRFENKTTAAELEAAYREMLIQAGWKPLAGKPLMGDHGFRYTVDNRVLDIGVAARMEYDVRPTVSVWFADPAVWPPLLPLLQWSWQDRNWEIEPRFEPDGRASAATRLEIFVLASRVEIPANSGTRVLVVPVVAADRENDSAAQKNAHAAAQWVRDELVRRGIDAKHLRVFEEIKPPRLKGFDVKVGARVTALNCRTVTETRPDRIDQRCDCSADFGAVSTTAGACK